MFHLNDFVSLPYFKNTNNYRRKQKGFCRFISGVLFALMAKCKHAVNYTSLHILFSSMNDSIWAWVAFLVHMKDRHQTYLKFFFSLLFNSWFLSHNKIVTFSRQDLWSWDMSIGITFSKALTHSSHQGVLILVEGFRE